MPHEIAAPVSNDSSSGSGTSVLAGAFIHGACAPCPVTPYTTMPSTQSCDQPTRQWWQTPQPL